jgi:hypothetical protein
VFTSRGWAAFIYAVILSDHAQHLKIKSRAGGDPPETA